MDSAFAIAKTDSLSGVVIAIHADPRFQHRQGPYQAFLTRLAEHTASFPGQVLLIHGDSHEYRLDHPLMRLGTGEVLENFTRLETYGSPDIGWVRVVVDSVAGRIVEVEPRLIENGRASPEDVEDVKDVQDVEGKALYLDVLDVLDILDHLWYALSPPYAYRSPAARSRGSLAALSPGLDSIR